MDFELFKKYEHVTLSHEMRVLLTEIIMSDEATRKVFLTIGKETINTDNIGLTIKQLSEKVTINRKVQEKNGTFKTVHTNIDRKHVERVVEKLLGMSVCYYRSIPPSKVISLTIRGKEVIAELKKHIEKNKTKGEEKKHVHE